MKPTLAAFQDAFVRALHGAAANDPRVAAFAAQPGFAVYRNTVFKGCVDALRANFPTVERLVGVDWFRSAALIYAQDEPPEDARLLLYGTSFPAFLAGFEPARELPWLADVARLDRFWTEAHVAADDTVLGAAGMASLSPEDFMRTVLRPHASARWAWFDQHPVYTIWSANREAVALPEALAWHGEGALLSRAGGAVTWRALGKGGYALLDACAAGRAMEEATACALEAEPDLDLGALFAGLFADGAFGAAQFPDDTAAPTPLPRKQSKTDGA
ncbi:HvfC/BufC N-terminal domain-containing protein [Paraburkholderia ferrariae]|uniref:HvfC/BufC N-terminal domain-containing protein n=1 Tax=Paraburkholderia ferrariae TaxID=386056 RepID=UPI0005A8B05B|nr:DNA-binding domain-containing protein [Paraburkholderia ferrariae]